MLVTQFVAVQAKNFSPDCYFGTEMSKMPEH